MEQLVTTVAKQWPYRTENFPSALSRRVATRNADPAISRRAIVYVNKSENDAGIKDTDRQGR